MKSAEHWANLIQIELSDGLSLAEEFQRLTSAVEKIQADARSGLQINCRVCGNYLPGQATGAGDICDCEPGKVAK